MCPRWAAAWALERFMTFYSWSLHWDTRVPAMLVIQELTVFTVPLFFFLNNNRQAK